MSEPSEERRPVPLSGRQRVMCAVAGTVPLIFSGVLLVRGTDGAGTVAMIVVSAVMLLLAIIGIRPRSLNVGTGAMVFGEDEADKIAAITGDKMTPSAKTEAAAELSSALTKSDLGRMVSARFEAAAEFEHMVLSQIQGLCDQHGWEYDSGGDDPTADARIRIRQDRDLLIDLTTAIPGPTGILRRTRGMTGDTDKIILTERAGIMPEHQSLGVPPGSRLFIADYDHGLLESDLLIAAGERPWDPRQHWSRSAYMIEEPRL